MLNVEDYPGVIPFFTCGIDALFLAVLENSFLHTRKGYPRDSPVPTNLISPMLSHPGPDKNHLYIMH